MAFGVMVNTYTTQKNNNNNSNNTKIGVGMEELFQA